MTPVAFSPSQTEACDAVFNWFSRKDGTTFKLFGYAGTGKTSLAKSIAQRIERNSRRQVAFAAFTGKAASVLRNKGCYGASTIHSLIYRPEGKNPNIVWRLAGPTLADGSTALVIIDECSMVGEKLGADLLSFDVPVLVLGDPAQLPPVGDGGYFTRGEPDWMLTEIHRQQEGSGILDIATAVRMGERLALGDYSESRVIPLHELRNLDPFSFDQVIVGRNATRRSWNARMRMQLGLTDPLPVKGDKLICLRNNKSTGLMNGEIVTVIERGEVFDKTMRLSFDRDGVEMGGKVSLHYFSGVEGEADWEGNDTLFFDYGYAVTGHKSQGSQWPRVLVIDESRCFRDDAARWLYTAVTRAAEHVTVVK